MASSSQTTNEPLPPPSASTILAAQKREEKGEERVPLKATEPPKKMSVEAEELLQVLLNGIEVKRVKQSKLHQPSAITIDETQRILRYPPSTNFVDKVMGRCAKKTHKTVEITDLMEVREGYRTDGLHKASKIYKFRVHAPEERCFSLIFKHPKFVCKSVDFVTDSEASKQKWIKALKGLVAQFSHNVVTFDEKLWLSRNFKKADLNRNGEITFDELWKLLKRLNLQMSEAYVRALFKQVLETPTQPKNGSQHNSNSQRHSTSHQHHHKNALDENGFFELFKILSDLPEYRSALRHASGPADEEAMDVKALVKFLHDEQKFEDADEKQAEQVIQMFETGDAETKKEKLSINGFRRLLQSRWGFIMKPGHETVFQDMDQPLPSYFINSSHNTYLTGLQVRGNATVEGYISALRRGARLLELDLFDGDYGEPQITHKRTFITSITLRNALKCIVQYAFESSPYPLILTLENHVGFAQQTVMADIFVEILGDKLYIPPADFGKSEFPSPNKLKHKILLRGKVLPNSTNEEDAENPEEKLSPREPAVPAFGKLIALPSVKLTQNLYADIHDHPFNGSPSLSESKVETYLESGAPITTYTMKHIIKSYPRGLRQDSSNMNPVPSWISGIQSVAMNMQTCGEDMDLVNGLFSINGNCGYVLKPNVLLKGIDPRNYMDKTPKALRIAVICGQYLPKPEPSSDIVDPYVTVEIFGIPIDISKTRTRAIRNNGFNPVWNEQFEFKLHCPEVAILRFVVKDFDSTSSNDFIGEFSVPVESVRAGYSHIRLNTGPSHIPDDAASIFVRIELE